MKALNTEDIYELSPMQQGVLFDILYSPQLHNYFVQTIFEIEGHLEVGAFRAAWQTAIDRHEVLRTSFQWQGLDKAYQVVHRSAVPNWIEEDWRAQAERPWQQLIEQYLVEDRAAAFNISQPPLIRFALFRINDELHEFVLSSHHLILDGWSKAILVDQVLDTYDDICTVTTRAAQSSRTYRGYIEWLQEQDLFAAESYWRGALSGFHTRTPLLPVESQLSTTTQPDYAECIVRLSKDRSTALADFVHQSRLTLNVVALGAWALLLSRYNGRPDVLFGTTVTSRPADLAEIDSRIGLFINTLPVRVKVEPWMQVSLWLQRLQTDQVAARVYDYTPLTSAHIWSELPPGEPIFETLFVFENYPTLRYGQKRPSGLKLRRGRSIERANVPFSLLVVTGDELEIKAIYDRSRFASETVQRLLGHYQMLLQGMMGDSHPLSHMPLLSPAEREQMLVEWNKTDRPYMDGQCFHDLFFDQVRRTPDNIAAVFEGKQLTYAYLNTHANRVAHYLRDLGARPEVRVALFIERGLEFIVAFLGILKAGATYVPLDPSYPSDRLAFMLIDSGATIIVTEERLRARLPQSSAVVVRLDSDSLRIAQYPCSELESEAKPDNAAYLIYTSGSTGAPKGVIATHRGLCNVAMAQQEFGLTPHDRKLQFASISFDASVFEISMALTVGAALIFLPQDKSVFTARLFQLMGEGYITAATLTPSVVVELRPEQAPALHILAVAGERCTAEMAAQWSKGRRFWNLYGPTEATIWATAVECSGSAEISTIGKPIANTRTYILDPELNPLPIGVGGELYISGAGVARGYLGRPALTAEHFVPDCFSAFPGARMYRTGDRARYLGTGDIEFLGRGDHQVKLRGFRVELGEIEAVLRRHPLVRDCVALIYSDEGERQIVAYAVPVGAVQPSVDGLREWMARQLPSYMMPSAFVVLDRWPLNSSGKLNRTELPPPFRQNKSDLCGVATPKTELEHSLSELWREVLRATTIDIDENFFDLGGNSLLLLRMYSALASRYGSIVTMVDIFSHPTVRTLAAHLSSQSGEQCGGGNAYNRGEIRRASMNRRYTDLISGKLND